MRTHQELIGAALAHDTPSGMRAWVASLSPEEQAEYRAALDEVMPVVAKFVSGMVDLVSTTVAHWAEILGPYLPDEGAE